VSVLIPLAIALLGLLVTPICVGAEPSTGVEHVGVLYQDPKGNVQIDWLRESLRDLGYVEGKTIAFEPRLAGSGAESLQLAATELVGSGVNLVVAVGTPAALALQKVSSTIPLVFVVGDPVASGLVARLGRPGGNATGLATLAGETGAKRLELLKEVLPHATRIGVLVNPDNPATASQLKAIETAAHSFDFKLRILMVHRSGDLNSAFAEGSRHQINALIVVPDPILIANTEAVAQRALKRRVPSIFESREFATSGGLFSYGASSRELWRTCAGYVDKILKGAKPSDLPVEQPTKFALVVNLKTAQTLRIKIPESILLRADEVIK
jgi:putative ABC transport system substrate-binding protein